MADRPALLDHVAAHAANAAYATDEPGTVLATVGGAALSTTDTLARDHLQCVILHWASHVVVSFRGSQSRADWLETNIKTSRVAFRAGAPGSLVHEGFYAAYAADSTAADEDGMLTVSHSLLRQIIHRLRDGGTRRVLLTGHSMGGALATVWALCASRLSRVHSMSQSANARSPWPRCSPSPTAPLSCAMLLS